MKIINITAQGLVRPTKKALENDRGHIVLALNHSTTEKLGAGMKIK